MRAYGATTSDCQIYKFHQYQLRANSPNLMLTKVIHYMVQISQQIQCTYMYNYTAIYFIHMHIPVVYLVALSVP